MDSSKNDLLLSENTDRDEEISTSLERNRRLTTESADIPEGEESLKEVEMTVKSEKMSSIIKSPLTIDIEIMVFSLTVKSYIDYHWNVYKTMGQIKENFEAIEEELEKKRYSSKDNLQTIFSTVKGYSLAQVKGNINQIVEWYLSFFHNETIKQCITLLEFFSIGAGSFSQYNSGMKPMEGYALKKADPRCCRKLFGCLCACVECIVFPQWNKRWIVLKNDMIYYTHSSTELEGKNVYFFDDQIDIRKEEKNVIYIANGSRVLRLQFLTEFEQELWFSQINSKISTYKEVTKNNIYKSYTNAKKHNLANWFSDGEHYFADLKRTLLSAKETIFITDWWLSPEVFLERPVKTEEYMALAFQHINAKEHEPFSRLMDILNHVAERGVQVYILIYCEATVALTLNSKHSKNALTQLNSNIKVTRHPKDLFDLLWSHHEKLVVVDQKIGYVGGLDLCWGRFDTNEHPLYEPKNRENNYLFPGIDYSNARICDFTKVENYLVESVDRATSCRMPWHDVHIKLEGPVVADIARHFVQRWNHARFETRESMITTVKGNASVNRVNLGGAMTKDGKMSAKIPWLGKIIDEAEKEEKPQEGKKEELKPMGELPETGEIVGSVEHLEVSDAVGEEQQLEEKLRSGKTIIDDDHAMVPGNVSLEQLMAQKGAQKMQKKGSSGSAYNSFVSGMAKVEKKKKSWFRFSEEARLEAVIKFTKFRKEMRSTVQVLRSGSEWSMGTKQTEHSILNAYYDLIDNSKHYIYIENQFFVSKSFTEEERDKCKKDTSRVVENMIAYHIRKRIEKAYQNKEKFRVYIFIPLLPGFAGEPETSGTLQIILKHTYGGIAHNHGLSIIEKLKEIMTEDEIKEYIAFYSLRGHAVVNNVPVTELIYIHSKLMIIDDEAVLIGSANINDRSMLGTRDSEFAVIVKEHKNLKSSMDGHEVKVAKFAADFRRALMAEHLGIKADDPILVDPLSGQLHSLIKSTAKNNTLLYREIFGCYPDDTYTNYQKLKEGRRGNSDEEIRTLQIAYEKKKDSFIGHIVEFPYDFLYEEKLGLSFFSVENVLPEKNFT